MTVALSSDFLTALSNLERKEQKRVREFVELFRISPEHPGTNLEKIEAARDRNLLSARINEAYRAIICRPEPNTYILLWVDHHDEAYRWAERKKLVVNPSTGSLQIWHVEQPTTPAKVAAAVVESSAPPALFAQVKDKHLLNFGIPEPLISEVRSITTEKQLEEMSALLPKEAYEALFFLQMGLSVEEVFRELATPELPVPNPAPTFTEALTHPDSLRRFYVVPDDEHLQALLNMPLEHWRIYLHPKQRSFSELKANGPVRVLGGAGTGKTVVAMHRARYLLENVFTQPTERILFTTFTRNLAVDINEDIRKIVSPKHLARIDVENLDGWVSNFLRSRKYNQQALYADPDELDDLFKYALTSRHTSLNFPDSFYRSEWEQVIQPENIRTEADYLRAPRLGRGTRLSREQRKLVWHVFAEYRAKLEEEGRKEFIDLQREACELLTKEKIQPYAAVIVDETQDFSPQALRLIRALAQPGPNDLFLVGDSHQRIYRQKASLGKCGIDIRGRGKKLRLNYRTTEETRRFALSILEGKPFDDLDGGSDDLKIELSLTHGLKPSVHSFTSASSEQAFVSNQIRALVDQGVSLSSICVVARTRKLLERIQPWLERDGLATYTIKRDQADLRSKEGIRFATMHRIKGLEFEHVFLVAAEEDVIPLRRSIDSAEDPAAKRQLDISERSLLYVALTRAQKSATISGIGALSPYLPPTTPE
jgi:superfamily I DNA/RNA helicase